MLRTATQIALSPMERKLADDLIVAMGVSTLAGAIRLALIESAEARGLVQARPTVKRSRVTSEENNNGS